MLSWLYDVFMSIVTFILGLFGVDLSKKTVTFADDVAPKAEAESEQPASETQPAEPIA